MPPMFRLRTGTGGLYAENLQRRRLDAGRRGSRRTNMLRAATADRPWARKDLPVEPIAFDLEAIMDRMVREAHQVMGLLRDVGEEFQFCSRRRQRLDPGFVSEFSEIIGWYLVFYTLGLVDRRGVWLGPAG